MSSNSKDEGEVPHYAYMVLRLFPPFTTEIALLYHHAITNDIFLHGGRVDPRPFMRMKRVKIFLLETLTSHIGF